MYRNCNYGFSYEINGRSYNGKDVVVVKNIQDDFEPNIQWISYVKVSDNIFLQILNLLTTGIWCIYYEGSYDFARGFKLRIYLGWKMRGHTQPCMHRSMLALFFHPFRRVN